MTEHFFTKQPDQCVHPQKEQYAWMNMHGDNCVGCLLCGHTITCKPIKRWKGGLVSDNH